MGNKKQHNLTLNLFSLYFIILVWILLFKMSFSFSEIQRYRNINLIPLSGTAIVNGRIHMTEVINNILIFIPVGIYTSMLKPKWSIIKKISIPFLMSLIIEVFQYILAVGATDITDIIGNTLGGVVGIIIYYLFYFIFRKNTIKILNFIACVASVFLVGLLAMLIIAN